MKVKDVMTRKVLKMKAGSTLAQAAGLLIRNNISGAPVVNASGKLVGIVSEKDIFAALYPNFRDMIGDLTAWFDSEKREYKLNAKRDIVIDSIMTRKVVTIRPEEPILDAGSKMIMSQIHRLVVVGKQKKIVGIVTRRDIFKNILKKDLNIK